MTTTAAHRRGLARWRPALLAAMLAPAAQGASAGALQYCTGPVGESAARQGQLLVLAAQVKQALAEAGEPVALLSRSGLDLSRFGQVYSHAGLALRDSANSPWSVRQLYFACAEGQSRVFDEGLAGFVRGAGAAERPRIALVLLPPAAGAALAAAALDNRRALALLHPRYSANAHAYSTLYQNCNQWVAELMATAWAAPAAAASAPALANTAAATPPMSAPAAPRPRSAPVASRAAAQAWLRAQGYQPVLFQAGPWRGLSLFSPYLHEDDHPPEAAARGEQAVSMPASLEAWVQRQWPGARRLEWCLSGHRVVARSGWQPLDDACQPGPGDQVHSLR